MQTPQPRRAVDKTADSVDTNAMGFRKDQQYYKFCAYGFLKNLRFFDPFMVLFLLERGLNYLEIGSLYAIKEVFINVTEIPSGVLADAVGRRRTMVVSFLAYIAAFVLFFLGRGFGWAAVAMIFFAFGDAFRTGTHKAMIFEYLRIKGWDDQKVYYYGHTRSWSQVGSAVSALAAAAMVFWRGDYETVFVASTIPYLLDLVLIISYPAALDGTAVQAHGRIRDSFATVLRDLVTAFRNVDMVRAIGNQAVYSGYYKACKDFLQPIIKTLALALPIMTGFADAQRSALLIGGVYSLLYVVTSFGSAAAGGFAARFAHPARPITLTLVVGAGLGMSAGVAYALGLGWIAVLCYVGVYVMENLRKPIGIALVGDLMGKNALATALSAESQAESLFAAGFALLLGAIGTAYGLAVGLIVVSIVAGVIGLLVSPRAAQRLRR